MDDSTPVGISEDGLEDCVKDTDKSFNDTVVTAVPGMGSIVYKRINSGEIVASIVRDANEDADSNTSNTLSSAPKKMVMSRADSIDDEGSEENESFRRKKKKLKGIDRSNSSCPINERNVENILDRTLLVTESLQQLLNTYKDDLKRVGGGQLKITGIKKRIEIARKMTKAYINYQQAIDDIAELGRNEKDFDDEEDEDYDEDDYYEDDFGKQDEPDLEMPEVGTRLIEKKRTPKKSDPPRNYPAPSRFPEFDDSSRSWREEMVAAKENKYWYGKEGRAGEDLSYGTNVSDDLWMSCEPGSDDEAIYNVGFPKALARK